MNILNSTDRSFDKIANLSVKDLGKLYRTNVLSPLEVVEDALDRIQSFQDKVNAFAFIDRNKSLTMAKASADRFRRGRQLGPLDGVPVSVKDLQPLKGWPFQRGSNSLSASLPAKNDSPAVARLREAGCVFIGKTATAEAGSRIVTRTEVNGVTRNPYDLCKTPGGSSGGAAAALALRMGTLALGTDGAGSIRIPASFCNLVGMKPGFGRVPDYPPSIDMPHSVIGPMARRVSDLTQMLSVMSLPDLRDPYAWPLPFDEEAAQAKPLNGYRIAISSTLGTSVEPDTTTLNALSICERVLKETGAIVDIAEPIWPVDPYEPFMVFWEASYAGSLSMYSNDKVGRMGSLIRDIASRGRSIDIIDYHRALHQRVMICAAAHNFFNEYDAVIAPVMTQPAFDIDDEAPEGEQPDDWSWCPYTYIFNMTGQPALSVPITFTDSGLPIGIQIAGAIGDEEKLLVIGEAIESALDVCEKQPNLLEK